MAGGWLRWFLTVLFGATALVYCVDAARHRDRHGATASGLHLVMCGAMVAMLWPWLPELTGSVSVVVFAAAAVWFVVDARRGAAVDGHADGGSAEAWYHAGMMASMVWMAVSMQAMSSNSRAMSMPAGHVHAAAGMTAPAWIRVPAAVLTVGFVAAAATMLGMALARWNGGRGGWGPTGRALLGVVTAVGMAVAFAAMV